MERNIVIVHFNTPEVTKAEVRSIRKHTPSDCRITIFDNSDKRPFKHIEGVDIIDNTKGQLIDFKALLNCYPDKIPTTCNDWGSVKHCYTVDYLWNIFGEGFVLMDSDVLVKKDITSFFDARYPWVGTTYWNPDSPFAKVPRVLPFLCWINVPLCRDNGIRYYDHIRNWKLHPGGPETWYDTGASFLEDCRAKKLEGKEVDIYDYIVHYGAGSDFRKEDRVRAWMHKHEDLWKGF